MKNKTKRIFLCVLASILLCMQIPLVFAAEKTMTLNNTSYSKWGILEFVFTGVGTNDWIGVYPREVIPGTGTPSTIWEYATEGEHALHLGGRLDAGLYTAYFLENDGYTILGSAEFEVTGNKFTLDNVQYMEDDTLTALYTFANEKDWIGLYKKGSIPQSGNPALAWGYTTTDGFTSLPLGAKFPAGEYTAFYCYNDGYTIIDSINFTVTEKVISKPDAPLSVEYTRATDAKPGRADGVVTVIPSAVRSAGALLFWADSNGPLEDFTYFGYANYNAKDGKYIYNMTPGNLIPEQATHIAAYGINGTHYDYMIEKALISDDFVMTEIGCDTLKLPEPKYSFEVISDLHVTAPGAGTNIYNGVTNNDRTSSAFRDIATNQSDSTAIVVVGDLVNYGQQEEYDQLHAIIESENVQIPIYYAIGNHEFYHDRNLHGADGFDISWTLFRKIAGWDENDGYYRYKIINGDYYIFMGTEGFPPGVDTAYGYYSAEQRAWLKNLLEEADKTDANAFVFMHQSIEDTVSGSFISRGQAWSGINDDEEMRAVIESYENTFLFTGHSHWNLNSYGPFINGDGKSANYFNTASTGYLWSDMDTIVPGSEGLHVEVYSDYVIVRGRDFANQKWIPNVLVQVDKNVSYEASIGETNYATLSDAINDAQSGDTVTLISDCSVDTDISIPNGVTVDISSYAVNGAKLILGKTAKGVSSTSNISVFDASTLVAESKDETSFVYTASPYKKDFISNDGVQVRDADIQGLRFIAKVDEKNSTTQLTDYGFIVIPYSYCTNGNLTLYTDGIKIVSSALRGTSFNLFEDTDTHFSYTACIIGIRDNLKKFVARPYAKYNDNGVEYTIYGTFNSDYILSMNDVSQALEQ